MSVTSPAKKAPSRKKTATKFKITAEQARARFEQVLVGAEPKPALTDPAAEKKNYAQRLSTGLAQMVADTLRDGKYFPGVLPNADGSGQESPARTGKGVKKLDVNYSTPQLGLGLGVSIKTINFLDQGTGRYTKNATRVDNELRAEALDYHKRQPYAVLVAVVYLPVDACDDGTAGRENSSSSFAQVVNVLRHRAGRGDHDGDKELFEAVYVGLYYHTGPERGHVAYFDVTKAPPQFGFPAGLVVDYDELVKDMVRVYDQRNSTAPAWQSVSAQQDPPTLEEVAEVQEEITARDEDMEVA